MKITARGTAGDVIYIISNSGYFATINFNGNIQSQTFEMTKGQKDDVLLFQSIYGKKFLIDEVVIKQDVKNGNEIIALTHKEKVNGNENNTYRFSGLTKKENVVFAYDLNASYTRGKNSYNSPMSDRILVSFESGLQQINPSKSISTVFANGHEVCVILAKDAVISVYDLAGCLVKIIKGQAGVNLFNIDEDGVHIVTVETEKKKILIY